MLLKAEIEVEFDAVGRVQKVIIRVSSSCPFLADSGHQDYLSARPGANVQFDPKRITGQDMPSQQSVEEARVSNAALDEALRSNGVVDRELYLRLCDMHSYRGINRRMGRRSAKGATRENRSRPVTGALRAGIWRSG